MGKIQWRDLERCKKMEPFTLVNLLLQDGKIKPGWWTGIGWDGLNLRKKDVVMKWSPFKEEAT